MKPITVLLAEDHTILRDGLSSLLKADVGIMVVGEASNGREAVKLACSLHPDVVLMDIAMPLLNGLEATRQILAAAPATRILILSAHGDRAYVEHVVALGAAGYLLKQTAASILSKAIRQVHQGSPCFSPTISRLLDHKLEINRTSGALKNQPLQLTPREVEVLQLVAEGKANKETAEELHISIKTVEKHRHSLMQKLGLNNTADLTRHAIACGIIESSVQLKIL